MNNLDRMRMRAIYANNDRQIDSMIKNKQKSFHRALLYSYQSGWIKKDAEDAEWCRALINPNKLKFDYDEKIISVDWKHDFAPGDSFEWPKDSSVHWLILEQELTERAYFRGSIRRCQEIIVKDDELGENVTFYAAIRGPIETTINSIQKSNIVADVPNLSLDIYMRCTEQTKRLFDRYCRFSFAGRVWQVQAPDAISTPGILEVTALEDYDCQHDELIEEIVDPNEEVEVPTVPQISGETFIKPLQQVEYITNMQDPDYEWSVTLASSNKSVSDVLEWSVNGNMISITWTSMVSGQFEIHYGPLVKTVIVESLF